MTCLHAGVGVRDRVQLYLRVPVCMCVSVTSSYPTRR